MNLKTEFKQLKRDLSVAKSVVILTHISPDGDALGSLLAMKAIVRTFSNIQTIDAIIIGKVPGVYRFLPEKEIIKNPDDPSLLFEYDLALIVDCATKDRLAFSEPLFNRSKKTFGIDHHESNTIFADVNIIDPLASATGEIIYNLLKEFNIELNPAIATYLYTAILTDTGGFKYGNTTQASLSICAELIGSGANAQKIYQECFENKPFEMVKLHSVAMNLVRLSEDKKIAWTLVSRDMLNRLDAKDEYIEGLVELLRQIDTVEIAMLFKETKDGNIKVSLRSKKVGISNLAAEFNGGGHKFAAGCTMKGYNLATAIETMIPKAQALFINNSC
jgi:phosphoesterase RecJ-like protein